jgi:hypothetical protein
MNRFFDLKFLSVHRSSGAWLEHSDVSDRRSWSGNLESHSALMKTLSIFFSVRWLLSLLQVNNLPSKWISFSTNSFKNRQN